MCYLQLLQPVGPIQTQTDTHTHAQMYRRQLADRQADGHTDTQRSDRTRTDGLKDGRTGIGEVAADKQEDAHRPPVCR